MRVALLVDACAGAALAGDSLVSDVAEPGHRKADAVANESDVQEPHRGGPGRRYDSPEDLRRGLTGGARRIILDPITDVTMWLKGNRRKDNKNTKD